ncbi:Gfo/Idh/MocA family protein [Plantactinospora sp. KBS50]|uniref:Gfo/Idh/MocA family protein n=1 Tax=Plantactinospora sp. KBS50 TaxID=2024580 RepID=UPI000BAB054E|nr:Gfo/Idh/MocA family oxidoreductase [Plantactinospora sp. KBS50]ASW55493.1 oxidoreductase [Plantactinospora sp. KBS50]
MSIPPDPVTAPALNWGVLGAGFIAGKFVNAVSRHTRSTVVAVGSRAADKAAAFATEHGIDTAHGSYRSLVEDPNVQAVYVATPHVFHLEHALLAIGAGKPVLVEKPLAVNAGQGRALARAAAAAGVFAMEAMWTRFLPHMARLRDLVAAGDLGDLLHVHAEHAQRFAYDPRHRLYDPALAGGALLDLGVYPLALVQDLLGRPGRVEVVGSLTRTGVDGQVTLAMHHGGRRQASVNTCLWALSGIGASVLGTQGRVTFDGPFLRPTTLRLHTADGTVHEYDGVVRNGFQYEIAEVARCVAQGRTESPTLPLADSIAVLEVIDGARRTLGVRYPAETA